MRPATEADDAAIVALLALTLGWADDDRHRALFHWKHRTNPFGPSPGWVAEQDGSVVASRTLMRWRFAVGGRVVTTVRAVDTATHPEAQGRGLFRSLTRTGIEAMTAEGVGWVWNTPNDRSLGGYLSLGWEKVGRLPVALRPAGLRSLPVVATARRPADLWSLPTTVGEEAGVVCHETDALADLLATRNRRPVVRTDTSPHYLQWRYGQGPVGYRALLAGRSVADGVAFFRLRRRGRATEAVIGDLVVPDDDRRSAAGLARRILTATGADHAVVLGHRLPGWIPVPGAGPLLTWRGLADPQRPPIGDWDLRGGDVELF